MEFEINGVTYRANKLNARTQMDVIFPLLPLIGEFASVAKSIKSSEDMPIDEIFKTLSKLEKSSRNEILDTLLSGAERSLGNGLGWAPVFKGVLMYQDLELPSQLLICYNVFKLNMTGFLNAVPQSMKDQLQAKLVA